MIAGAGPAGSSLAIRLARAGLEVTLVERDKFPRHKLCGEFISPECLRHFAALGVLEEMLSAGGERIYETRFHDRRGRTFTVPSSLLDGHGFGLSLSRSRMDNILLEKARDAGVTVLDGHRVSDVAAEGPVLKAVTATNGRETATITADLFVDATGRSGVLSKVFERKFPKKKDAPQKPLAVGFKAHLTGTRTESGVCEIFSFPSGYGGLTPVEGGLANLCFMMAPRAARRLGSDPDRIVDEAVCRNVRAAHLLKNAGQGRDWLAVSVNSYGRSNIPAAENLFTVGDAAAFIDPFTGSGMLMALESSALLASAVASSAPASAAAIAHSYRASYDRIFSKRLRVCSVLRRAAFVPVLPSLVIGFLNLSGRSRNYLAASVRTRSDPGSKFV